MLTVDQAELEKPPATALSTKKASKLSVETKSVDHSLSGKPSEASTPMYPTLDHFPRQAAESEVLLVADVLQRVGSTLTVDQAQKLSAKLREAVDSMRRCSDDKPMVGQISSPPMTAVGNARTQVAATTEADLTELFSKTLPSSKAGSAVKSKDPPSFFLTETTASNPFRYPGGPPPLKTKQTVPSTARVSTAASTTRSLPATAPLITPLPTKPSAALPSLSMTPRPPAPPSAVVQAGLAQRQEREKEFIDKAVTSALFLMLESALVSLGAASGAVYIPRSGEMICVCHAGAHPIAPPMSRKHLAANSMTHGVWSSGVSIHQHCTHAVLTDDDEPARQLLMFPIPVMDLTTGHPQRQASTLPTTRRGSQFASKSENRASIASLNSSSDFGDQGDEMTLNPEFQANNGPRGAMYRSLGVVQFVDKYGGFSPMSKFTETDEATGSLVARLMGCLLSRYPSVQLGTNRTWFDPVSLHKAFPFNPPSVVLEGGGPGTGTTPAELLGVSADLQNYEPAPLVHRTQLPISLTRRAALGDDAAALGAAPKLQEIDAYVTNLHDCWKVSVELNVAHHVTEGARNRQMANLREELTAAKREIKRLSEQVRLDGLSAADYQHEYTTLKQELDSFLQRRNMYGSSAVHQTAASTQPPRR